MYPSYDHDTNVKKFNEKQENDFPVLYMSFASSKDPDWDKNHPNKATMEVIVPSAFMHYEKWAELPWKKRGESYEAYKEDLSKRIIHKPETLLIHGENDDIVPCVKSLEAKDFLERNKVSVQLEIIKNCGHHIPIEASSIGLKFIKKIFNLN